MIITLPNDSHIHHFFFRFPSHVHIPSHYTSHLLHTLFINPKNSSISLCHSYEMLKKKKKKRKRRKVKRKSEIRSYKKENKWGNLLPSSLPPPSSPPSTLSIHLIWEYNYHKWYLLCFKSTLFICIFAFNHDIPLEIVSFFPSATSHDASQR